MIANSHHRIDEQLVSIIANLRRQADFTFGEGKPWSQMSYAGFGDRLIEHGKALVDLGENFNSGKPPQWRLDQHNDE